jgi:hypothetical protein
MSRIALVAALAFGCNSIMWPAETCSANCEAGLVANQMQGMVQREPLGPLVPFVRAAAVGPIPEATTEPRFRWAPAIKQSLFFMSLQHAFRLATEPGTRAELRGPFFKDWLSSIRGYGGWKDGDPAVVNYVGHPMMGSVAGFIEIQNDRAGKRQVFGRSERYWSSRVRALLFSAGYSALFELGPFSEASVGNVGRLSATSGMVDLVVTPTLGTGWLIAEDAVDRYVISKLEGKIKNRVVKILLRGGLNPSRSFASMLGGHEPWIRYDRGGIWRR